MQQLSWCGTNTYPHILMPAALQKIDIDPEQLLYTPKIVNMLLLLMADQPVSSAELKKLRTPVRAMFTKAFNELETEIKKKEVKKADVEKILRRLQTHHEKLLILNMRMEEALLRESASEDIFTAEYESVCEYEDNFSNIMTDYEALAEEDDVSTSTISGTAAMNYRLPKLEFKKFGGEPREWITFWSQFSTIDRDPQMPPETKFQYLFQATAENSEAREAVESFPPSADNYPKVIEYIKSRFGEDEMLVEIYVRDLLQNVLQNVRAEGKMSVVKLYDRLETQLRALETLGVARDKFAAMLYPLVESALPEDTLRVWERSQYTVSGRGVQDKLTQLMTFLKTEVKGESRVNMAKAAFKIDNNQDAKDDRSNRKSLSKKNPGSKMPSATDLANTTQIANTTRMRNNCIFCGNGHPSQECYSGQRMHLPEKKDKAKGKNVCFWCLLPGHAFKKCRIKPRCPVCGGKHYAIMCPTLEAQKTSHHQKAELKVSGESPATEQETANQFTSTTLNNATVGGVYLQTLIVKISGPKGKHNVRVLLDCGSQRSYISKRMVDALGLKRVQQVTLTHNLFGGGEIRQKKHNVYKVNVSSLNNEYMDDLKFLDQEVICGHISQVQDHTILNELKARGINLTDVYQGEERPIHMLIGSDLLSSILTGRMKILQSGVVATETKLGWTVMGPAIGNDMEDSCLIVTSLHVNSFDVQDLWKLDVLGIMDAAETKSRKDLIEASNTHFKETVKRDESGRYIVSLPWIAGHPPVPINRRTTENRLLTTTRNVQGKMLYEKYDTIFEEWEKEKIIEEVEDKWEECNYLPHRPVLKDSHTTPIRPVFDASCKKKGLPSLNQCLEKGDNLIELIPDLLLRFRLGKYGIIADIRKAFLQIQVREEDREFLRFLWWKKDQKTLKFYRHCRVVFGLTSSPFLLAATIKYHLSLPQFQDNRCAELLARSFYVDNCILSLSSTHDVKKFIKESSDIMMQAKFELRDWMWNEPGITEQDPASILGMKWHLQTDTIAINVQSLKNIDEEKSITKRSILSACHRIFDPIQFTCPATIKIKKMVQDAWKENKTWDEPLNEDRRVEFIKWRKQALELDQIKIPRWILPIKGRTTLHVFCDASAIAYATVIFMRIENASVIVVRFVEARNRLATIKRITIPRLELLACLIGARLLVHVLENLEESPEKIQCWTDFSPALYWIQQQENWAQFVSNRVKEITTLTKNEDWNHVAGEHNPADLPSRGESPSKFIKSGWWEGPKWLQEKKEDWPVSKVQYDLEAIEEERRKTVVAGFVAKKPEENPWYLNLYEGKREVTLTQILRVIAWMLRFKPSEYKGDVISQEELDSAEKSLVKIIQSESIGEEDPKMKQLHAFQDKEGLWRVKTRIVNRNDDELFRLPILIPTNHPVTELIVKSVHEKMYHCGAQTLRSVLREKFWIPKARQLVRHVIHKCPRCRRFEAKRVDVPEASLPQHRVRDVVVFEVTGIDLGGPLYLEDGQKVWFVIFTCGVYRAVHLELVTSLSTEALVGAVERFVARRGCPAVIYSDNGTNLVGLRNELYRVNFGVKWKLNPPAAPWWGGWIERIVGLTKKLLRRLLGKRVVNYEEMVTILENCERVINARPLTYIAEDNDDLVPLTPEMFLREPRAEGEIDLNEFRCNFGKSYEKRKRLLKDFRKRFRSEYLGLLVHHDNRKKQRQLKVGDIVLVEVENRKQINWPMGKITKVFPGTDNVRRLVEVKTKSGFMKRAVQRLFPLEVPSEDVEQGDGELKPAEDEIVREKTPGVESVSVQEKTTPMTSPWFNSAANLFNFGCRTFEAITADTSLDNPGKIQMATRGLMLTLVQEAELLLEDAFKGASLGRPNPTANVPIPSTSFASVVAEKDKPARPAPPKPKAKATFVNLAPSFESHVFVKSDNPKANPREILREIQNIHPSLASSKDVVASINTSGKVVFHTKTTQMAKSLASGLTSLPTGLRCHERPVILPRYCLFRVDGEVRDEELCESFRSNHSVQSLQGKRDIRVVHRSKNAAHSTSTVFIEVDNQVAEILGQHGRIPVAGLMHRYERSHTLKQCFRCCGFGHRASACPAAHPICYRCGSAEHEGIQCSVEPSQSCCCRCSKKSGAPINHFATSSSCAYIPSGIVARSNLHPIPLTSPDTAIGAKLDLRGANLEEFASFNDLHFLGPPVVSTWSNGSLSSSIDVTLASSSLAIHATRGLLDEMAFTDHIPIWTTFLDMVTTQLNEASTPEDIDRVVLLLTSILQSACDSSMGRRSNTTRPSKPWWTPELSRIRRNFFRGLYRACHNRPKAAIRKAKRKSWFILCEEVSSSSWSAIHRFIAWGRGSPRGPPLLKHDNGSPYNPHETCQAVLNHFFLPDTRPYPQRNAISAHSDEPEFKPWDVLRAIHRCGKRKAPGLDGLGSKCLDLGGPSLQFLLAELFTKCLRMGHFPRPWEEGRLILLPKPSNSSTSQLEKYRPITLLNTMAKVFERCILARLQWLADRHGWFFEDQYGFVNGRSAEDALASITQFIEERQAHWRKTLVISLDISKAFDTVWRPAIIQNLERLNCPESITGLVKSFLEDRRVSYSAWTATECTSSQFGTPQGSALSPFLWNIVARTIFTLPSIKDSRLIAYADDFTLMIQVRGRLPVSATNNFLERLTSWCTMYGLNINPSKTQACLFQWRNVHPNSETRLKILGQPLNIKKTITILGVEFDQTRGFVAHLRKITRRCRSISPRLTNSIQGKFGIFFSAGTRIFDAVVVPAFLYGASAWGRRALSNEGIRQLRSLHYNFAKRVLRGGPCTPTVSAISITGSSPLDIIVRSRTAFLKEINEGNFESRPGPASLPYPPDRRQLSFSLNIEEITTPIIFTDGSKNEAGVGAAIVPSSEDQQPVLLRLHPDCTAFQAELLAIRWGVRLVEEGYSREEITIGSDCKSALSAICTSGPVRSTLVAEIILALNTNQNVNLCWVPGHCGIDGNERADRAAKNAAVSTIEPSFSILPRSLARNHSRTAALDAWTEVYCQDHSNRHLRRLAHTPDRLLQFLPKVCPGEVTTTLLTRHGHVRADLVLWHPGEDPSCPHCMEEQQTVDHLLFRCPAFMRHRMQTALLLGKTSFDPVSLAGLPDSLQAWNFLTSWFGSAIGSM
ncbi:hypothetical protein LAZ67_X004128 [Cordylochernes scorpioides]|uniref:Pro-Pol polyprotein n=1 Tax=Cordylochernes scorpioides TaxID=51811 RepID=A0ABY6LUY6_9ARAC|nr:hypothetical protein LAZ67_X004128 [Cordylochernes scorpioides]